MKLRLHHKISLSLWILFCIAAHLLHDHAMKYTKHCNSLQGAPLIDFPYAHPAVQDSWPSCNHGADYCHSYIPACRHAAPKGNAIPGGWGGAVLPRDVGSNEAETSLQFLKDLFI